MADDATGIKAMLKLIEKENDHRPPEPKSRDWTIPFRRRKPQPGGGRHYSNR